MQRIICLDISAIAEGMMNLSSLLWCYHILVENIVTEREIKYVLMEGVMYSVIQVNALLAQ